MTTTRWLLIALLISNLVWGILFTLQERSTQQEHKFDLFMLEGSNEHWQIRNYRVMVGTDEITRGNATLAYSGPAGEVEQAAYFSVRFYEKHPEHGFEPVLSKTVSSQSGGIDLFAILSEDLGSITGAALEHAAVRQLDTYESAYAEIRWKPEDGAMRVDKIELDVADHIHME